MKKTFVEQFQAAVMAGTGIIGVSSRDLHDCIRQVVKFFNGTRAVMRWNCQMGVTADFASYGLGVLPAGLGEITKLVVKKLEASGAKVFKDQTTGKLSYTMGRDTFPIEKALEEFSGFTRSYYETLNKALEFSPGTSEQNGAVLIYERCNTFKTEPNFISGITNIRDLYARTKRVLILVDNDLDKGSFSGSIADIADDIWFIKHELPKKDEVRKMFLKNYNSSAKQAKAMNIEMPSLEDRPKDLERAVKALVGISGYQVEQLVSISTISLLLQKRFDLEEFIASLFEKKKEIIEGIAGLKVADTSVKSTQVGGLKALKERIVRIKNGMISFGAIGFFDELDKFFGATGSSQKGGEVKDSSGVTTEMIGSLCKWMESQNRVIRALILLGPAGTGKSLAAHMAADELGVPMVEVNMSAMKGGLVGESNQKQQRAFDTLDAISDGSMFIIAACNNNTVFPPEIRRRFGDVYFFDLQDQDDIWPIYESKYGIKRPTEVDYSKWTPAEINRVARQAYEENTDINSIHLIPQAISSFAEINELYDSSDGKYYCANTGEIWKKKKETIEEISQADDERKLDTKGW